LLLNILILNHRIIYFNLKICFIFLNQNIKCLPLHSHTLDATHITASNRNHFLILRNRCFLINFTTKFFTQNKIKIKNRETQMHTKADFSNLFFFDSKYYLIFTLVYRLLFSLLLFFFLETFSLSEKVNKKK
jgi:hypothetical protein